MAKRYQKSERWLVTLSFATPESSAGFLFAHLTSFTRAHTYTYSWIYHFFFFGKTDSERTNERPQIHGLIHPPLVQYI